MPAGPIAGVVGGLLMLAAGLLAARWAAVLPRMGARYDAPAGRDATLFGVDGICRTLRDTRDQSLEEAMEALFRASGEFTEGEGRHDDTSVVLVEREA